MIETPITPCGSSRVHCSAASGFIPLFPTASSPKFVDSRLPLKQFVGSLSRLVSWVIHLTIILIYTSFTKATTLSKMPPKAAAEKPVKKGASSLSASRHAMHIYAFHIAKSAGGGGKKLSPYNKFMKTELARLKETEPNMAHMERYTVAYFLPARY